jgi:hypothetical protein
VVGKTECVTLDIKGALCKVRGTAARGWQREVMTLNEADQTRSGEIRRWSGEDWAQRRKMRESRRFRARKRTWRRAKE